MDAKVGLKTITLTLFLNLFFYFLPEAALCHDFSLVDTVLKHKMPSQILIKIAQLVWQVSCTCVHLNKFLNVDNIFQKYTVKFRKVPLTALPRSQR